MDITSDEFLAIIKWLFSHDDEKLGNCPFVMIEKYNPDSKGGKYKHERCREMMGLHNYELGDRRNMCPCDELELDEVIARARAIIRWKSLRSFWSGEQVREER